MAVEDKYLNMEGLQRLVAKLKETYGEAFQWKGAVANVAGLPAIAGLTVASVGNVYNVTAAGKTTADFVEGAGKSLPANSNVVLSNTGTDSDPVLKWDVIGVFDISDKLTFGSGMPESPDDGDTFLYMGNTTYTYSAVADLTGKNPQKEGWYVSDGGDPAAYTLTTDTEPQSGTTYYTRAAQYVQGVIYQYDGTDTAWVAKSGGDTFVPITIAEIDSLFE